MTLVQFAAIVAAIVTIIAPVVAVVWRLSTIANKLEAALERVTKLESSHSRIDAMERAIALIQQKLEWHDDRFSDAEYSSRLPRS